MRMRFGTNEPNWFWRRKLRVEHDLFIVRGKFYPLGWAHMKWRSQYRVIGLYPDMPVLPWRNRGMGARCKESAAPGVKSPVQGVVDLAGACFEHDAATKL